MISAVFPHLRRWLAVLLTFILALACQFTLTSCNSTALKTEVAQVSQWVASTIGDPKTFNYAFSIKNSLMFFYLPSAGRRPATSVQAWRRDGNNAGGKALTGSPVPYGGKPAS